MASKPFIQIILQEYEVLNKIKTPSLSLFLAHRIIRIFLNEILANCTIKRGPLRDYDVLEFSCIFSFLVTTLTHPNRGN